ncbi:uncharacterized protein [Rutidosis leptorrhynchoides]|uniref:uncharacterized protein n=1 Tax=Rutidosis leptorrhynchoides TaxID=125765 RepID=UPI003A99590E
MSQIWKNVLNLQKDECMINLIGPNCWRWKLRGGSQISFWHNYWVGNFSLRDQYPRLYTLCSKQQSSINTFRWPEMGRGTQLGWILQLNGPLIFADYVSACNLYLALSNFHLSPGDDEIVWLPSVSGVFNVAEAMRFLVIMDNSHTLDWKILIWNNRVPSKISIFHWLACNRSIPVKDNLIRRHILPAHNSSLCVWCESEPETVEYLLLHCSWSYNIWSALFNWWNIRWVIPKSILYFSGDWFYGMGIGDKKFWRLIGPVTLWTI